MWGQPDHSTDNEVIATSGCPYCRAKITWPCVYTETAATRQIAPNTASTAQLALLDRIGTPTKRPHNERREAARRVRDSARRKAELEGAKTNTPKPVVDRVAAWRAEQEFDRREQDQLIMWLRCYSSILTEEKS